MIYCVEVERHGRAILYIQGDDEDVARDDAKVLAEEMSEHDFEWMEDDVDFFEEVPRPRDQVWTGGPMGHWANFNELPQF